MKSAKNTQAAKSGLTQTESATVFRKIWQKVFGRCKSFSSPVVPSVLLEVRSDNFEKSVSSALNNRIAQYRLLGYKVRVEPLQRQIPDECIGILTVESGELQGLQEYLKIREEHFGRKSLVSQQLSSIVPPSNSPALHNNHHSSTSHEISGKDNNNSENEEIRLPIRVLEFRFGASAVLIPIYADTTYDEIDEAIRNLETRNRRKTRKTKEAKQ